MLTVCGGFSAYGLCGERLELLGCYGGADGWHCGWREDVEVERRVKGKIRWLHWKWRAGGAEEGGDDTAIVRLIAFISGVRFFCGLGLLFVVLFLLDWADIEVRTRVLSVSSYFNWLS